MKIPCVFLVAITLLNPCDIKGQHASSLTAFEFNDDKERFIRSSLSLSDSHENTFWSLYDQFEQQIQISRAKIMDGLQQLAGNSKDHVAYETVDSLLSNRFNEAAIKQEFYEKIYLSTNGTIALQFLQSEALFDLLVKSRLYQDMNWEKPSWNDIMLESEADKISALEKALNISDVERERFRLAAEDYEFEYSRVVGHQMVFFEQCVENVEGLTPGQCKSRAGNFVNMQQNELELKERYMKTMNESFGPSVAAHFFALQEYFSCMAKLKTWSDSIADED